MSLWESAVTFVFIGEHSQGFGGGRRDRYLSLFFRYVHLAAFWDKNDLLGRLLEIRGLLGRNFNDRNQRFTEWSPRAPRCLPRFFKGRVTKDKAIFIVTLKMLLLVVFTGFGVSLCSVVMQNQCLGNFWCLSRNQGPGTSCSPVFSPCWTCRKKYQFRLRMPLMKQ